MKKKNKCKGCNDFDEFVKRQREKQKEEGAFDGRYIERSEIPKNKYNKKKKHKNKDFGET